MRALWKAGGTRRGALQGGTCEGGCEARGHFQARAVPDRRGYGEGGRYEEGNARRCDTDKGRKLAGRVRCSGYRAPSICISENFEILIPLFCVGAQGDGGGCGDR